MPTYHEFDKGEIDASIKAVSSHYDQTKLKAAGAGGGLTDNGHIAIAAAACLSVAVENGNVCLKLPLGVGDVCLPIPSWIPNGTAAQACVDLCTSWGIPTGVKVSVIALGRTIVQQSWGVC